MDAYSNPYPETVYIKIQDIKTGQEQTIISNRIHPFYVSTIEPGLKLVANGGVALSGTNDTGEWIEAQYLRAGHRLHNADNSWSEVVSVDIEKQDLKAYNLHVDQFHTFYVRGAANDNAKPVWVHNTKGCDVGFSNLNFGKQGREFRKDQLETYEFDAKLPKQIRGWLKQERNRGSLRTPPGYVQVHGRTTPAREGFDYSNSRLQNQGLNTLEERIRRRLGRP